jgi:hypothetical protein
LTTALAENLKAGEAVLANLRKIAAARGTLGGGAVEEALAPPKPAVTDTRAMVAAAQAFAERTRTRGRGFAA